MAGKMQDAITRNTMPSLNDTDQESMVAVLRALTAYVEGRLPPYDCTPHGPGHEGVWVQRAERLIDDARLPD